MSYASKWFLQPKSLIHAGLFFTLYLTQLQQLLPEVGDAILSLLLEMRFNSYSPVAEDGHICDAAYMYNSLSQNVESDLRTIWPFRYVDT